MREVRVYVGAHDRNSFQSLCLYRDAGACAVRISYPLPVSREP